MKRLVVMRHAKSDWDAGAESDHARPLNSRGKAEAPVVAAKLAARGFAPEAVTVSDARRTTETLELARPAWPGARVHVTPSFYHAGLSAVRAAVRELADDVTTWLVLGHNPGWEEMIDKLTGQRVDLKTCHAAVLESDAATFDDALTRASMKLVEVIKP
jgi:phosphohistidine phosphatase SixA